MPEDLEMEWAAVKTNQVKLLNIKRNMNNKTNNQSLINVPPHGLSSPPFLLILNNTAHGNSLTSASLPPEILTEKGESSYFLTPQLQSPLLEDCPITWITKRITKVNSLDMGILLSVLALGNASTNQKPNQLYLIWHGTSRIGNSPTSFT